MIILGLFAIYLSILLFKLKYLFNILIYLGFV